ncbi:MAG TPA: hypothetical protein P5127_07405, partial [Oscillospiraceae bacterium]|nr:hypothetical protein [Oscillospiraceae bacterium]
PVEIENVSSYNLNIKTTGTAKAYEIGGLVGDVQASALAFKLRNVHLQGHETEGSEIMGDQHVGGLVGRSLAKARTVSGDINAFIYDASLSDYTVTNRYDGTISNSTFEKAATGGIAGVFAGAMGDDPDTPAEEGLLISDCTITGNAAGGVLGKNDETYDNRYISITKVLVRGNTAVNNLNYDTADIANASAAGIAAVLSNEHQNSRVQVKNAIIQETVAINGIHYAAGIVAYTYGRVGSNYPDLEINFLNCQTFATITAHRLTVSNAGGIIGQHNGRFTRTKIRDCVIGGTISATNSAAGVIGVLNEIAAISTQLTAPVFKDTYVTASINSTGSYVAKIFGQVM